MFVSSYGTYITTNASQKSAKVDNQSAKSDSKLFATQLAQKTPSKSLLSFATPVNYVKQSNAPYNKELLRSQQEQEKKNVESDFKKATASTQKFSANLTLNSAKVAYTENSTLFSFLRKPQSTLEQTPKIDRDEPQNVQELQERNVRRAMVNAYVENDRYYQITAA